MKETMTTRQVVEVAVKAERNAAEFYVKCAEKYPGEAELFGRLAADERSHGGRFSLLADEEPWEIGESGEDLTALAEMAGSEGDLSEVLLTDDASPVEILAHAIEGEKNAVLLYLGLKNRVNREARATLDTIVEDELGHVAWLYRMAKEL